MFPTKGKKGKNSTDSPRIFFFFLYVFPKPPRVRVHTYPARKIKMMMAVYVRSIAVDFFLSLHHMVLEGYRRRGPPIHIYQTEKILDHEKYHDLPSFKICKKGNEAKNLHFLPKTYRKCCFNIQNLIFCRLFLLQKFGKMSFPVSSTRTRNMAQIIIKQYFSGKSCVFPPSAHPISPGRFVEGGGSDLPLGAEDGGHGL